MISSRVNALAGVPRCSDTTPRTEDQVGILGRADRQSASWLGQGLRGCRPLQGQGPAEDSHGQNEKEEAGADEAEDAAVAEEVVAGFGVNAK